MLRGIGLRPHGRRITGTAVVDERVRQSTAVFRRIGAIVDERIYPRMGHTINADELQAVDALLAGAPG